MKRTDEIISDTELEFVFANANFGEMSKRDVVNGAVLKCASGYHTGHTAKMILMELGLVAQSKWTLTKRGKEYLFAAYCNGVSI